MTPTKTSRFLGRALLASLLGAVTGGCAGVGILDHRLSGSAGAPGTAPDSPRDVYSVREERVTLSARLDGSPPARAFVVEWLLPDGRVYIRRPVRARRDGPEDAATVAAAMVIRDEPPSRHPGLWKVRLALEGEILLERQFEIRRDEPVFAGAAPGARCPSSLGRVARRAWRGTALLRRAGARYEGNVLLSSPQLACPPFRLQGRPGPGS